MEHNYIRNYNEITNNGITPGMKYVEKIVPISTDDDKDFCLRFLSHENKHLHLCHNFYNETHINSIIETGDYMLFFHEQNRIENIVAIAFVKLMHKRKGKILNILLVCAIPNKKKFGTMIAHALYNFAIKKDCKFLYTSPRTPGLRATFIDKGFEPIYGVEGVDEVLEKEVVIDTLVINRGNTRKVGRKGKIEVGSRTDSS